MKSSTFETLFLGLCLAYFVSYTNATTKYSTYPSNDTLTWGRCEDYAAPLECATFQVPLDYADASQGTTELSLIRLPAQASPREGYMFYNPGGPGASGLDLLGNMGAALQGQLGNGWDIISWDPRGIGKSGPNITFFDTYQGYDAFWNQLQGTGKLEAHGNLTQDTDVEFFRAQAPSFDVFLEGFDSKYTQESGDKLKYVGSCAAVRDLAGMVDAIYGVGTDINFYGFSYGTLIGAYLTQMFPDRIGKVILDGVVDAHLYTNDLPMAGLPFDLQDVESALSGWTAACASSSKCPLSSLGNGTAEGVMSIIDSVLNTAHKTYDGTVWSQMELLVNGTMPSDIHAWPYDVLARLLYLNLYSSRSWVTLSEHVFGLYALQNNLTSALASRSALPETLNLPSKAFSSHWSSHVTWGDSSNSWSQAVYAIGCGDTQRTPSNYTTSTVFEQIINVSQTISPHFGTIISPRWFCHRWSTRAVERLGDIGIPTTFDIKPKNVVLIIGNAADTITPFSSAKKLASAARLGDMARLVRFEAIGHSSASNNSTCINNVIRSYVQGIVPEDMGNDEADIVCEVDATPFS